MNDDVLNIMINDNEMFLIVLIRFYDVLIMQYIDYI